MADQVQDPTEQLKSLLAEPLNKAEGGEGAGKDDDDDYDSEKMKKHMKRFMKEEKSYMKDCLKNFDEAKDLKKSMLSEMNALDPDSIQGSDMVMIDGTGILEKSVKATEKLSKAVENILDGFGENYKELKDTKELLHKACSVIVELSEKVKVLSNEPVLQKSKTTIPQGGSLPNNSGVIEPLAKAKEIGYAKVKEKLFKSAIANPELNAYVGMLDACGGVFERLDQKALASIVNIASKET